MHGLRAIIKIVGRSLLSLFSFWAGRESSVKPASPSVESLLALAGAAFSGLGSADGLQASRDQGFKLH
jgi:hypothetical protein